VEKKMADALEMAAQAHKERKAQAARKEGSRRKITITKIINTPNCNLKRR